MQRTRIQLRESTIYTPSQVSSTSFPARIGAFPIPRAGAFGIGLAPGARTPLRARARCDSEPGMEGVIRQNTPKQGWRPLKTEPQPGDLPIFFSTVVHTLNHWSILQMIDSITSPHFEEFIQNPRSSSRRPFPPQLLIPISVIRTSIHPAPAYAQQAARRAGPLVPNQ